MKWKVVVRDTLEWGGGEIESSTLFAGSQASFACRSGNSCMKTGNIKERKHVSMVTAIS